MPLVKGPGTIRQNVSELMKAPESSARKKAILTISRKHNIPYAEAQFRQAQAIAKKQARLK